MNTDRELGTYIEWRVKSDSLNGLLVGNNFRVSKRNTTGNTGNWRGLSGFVCCFYFL